MVSVVSWDGGGGGVLVCLLFLTEMRVQRMENGSK